MTFKFAERIYLICSSVIHHLFLVISLAYTLILALVQGSTTWIFMTSRLLSFAMLLGFGWVQYLAYYFLNKHIIRDVKYGEEPRNYLDIYLPMKKFQNVRVPVVILVNGGAWIIGYRLWNALIARGLSYFGYLVVLPDYRNFPQGNIQSMKEDIRRAVEWCVLHIDGYGGDSDNIVIGGQSAGAHVSLALLVDLYRYKYDPQMNSLHAPRVDILPRIKLYIGISGPYNLTELIYHFHNRGLDYSILRWIFNNDMCTHSPSIQLAELAEVGMNKTFINVHTNAHGSSPVKSLRKEERAVTGGAYSEGSEVKESNDVQIVRMVLGNDYDDADMNGIIYSDRRDFNPGAASHLPLQAQGSVSDDVINQGIIQIASFLHSASVLFLRLSQLLYRTVSYPYTSRQTSPFMDSSYCMTNSNSPRTPCTSNKILKDFPAVALFHGKYDKSIPFETSIELSNILRVGGLASKDIHVHIYNHWGHTDGMLEEMLCGNMTLITDMYKMLYQYTPIVLSQQGEKNRGDVQYKEFMVEPYAIFPVDNQIKERLLHCKDFMEQMELFTPCLGVPEGCEEVGVYGHPHVPMVSKSIATIAKYINPF